MIRKVKLYARIKEQGTNNYPRIAVPFDKNGCPVPIKDEIKGYSLRIAGKFTDVGTALDFAVTRMRAEQTRLAGGVRREDVGHIATTPVAEISGRVRLSDAIARYTSELKTLDKAKDTVILYTNALAGFAASCKKVFIDEIDRTDILNYLDWMRKNLDVRVPGSQNRTLCNRLNYLGIFLGQNGIQLKKVGQLQRPTDPGLLFRADVPKRIKKKPKKHDQPRIELLMANADVDERDYLEVLLWSGFRDEEMEVLLYSDFNFRSATVLVQEKPQFDFHPKEWEEREITLPTAVLQRMKDRAARLNAGEKDLVFPNESGRRSSKLIQRLHSVAAKAGLNLKGQRAGHMFRKTAGSRVAKAHGLPAAMEFLGHSNIETTALYLAADTSDQKKKRQLADAMYATQGD